MAIPFAAAAAQVPSSDQPGRERQRFAEPPSVVTRSNAPTISLTGSAPPAGAANILLTVKSISVVGSTVYSAGDFVKLDGDLIGHRVSLAAIYDLAQKITAKYGGDGYVLSRAVVPPQNLDSNAAAITIRIVEGYVDNVIWPASLSRYSRLTDSYTTKIIAKRPANINVISRYLLLANELPGVSVTSQFRPSSEGTGASTLVVQAVMNPLAASARIDNRGTEARGPAEYEASATLNNALGLGGSLTGTVAGAFEFRELTYLSADYRQVLNGEGLTAFADASYSWGKPGTAELESLEFQSNSLAADFGLSLPLLRQRDHDFTLSGQFFLSNDEGDILAAPNSVDRLLGIRVKIDFDWRDQFNGQGQGNVTFSQGIDGLGSTDNGNPLASRENGRVDFNKIEGLLSRVQPLGHGFSLSGALYGQYAFTPLLAPEECGYGGANFGRAFDPSAITGDRCFFASSELRFDFPAAQNPLFDQGEIYGFIDYGSIYRIAPSAGTADHDEASSAGVGLRLKRRVTSLDLSAATPLSGPATGWRFFFSANASY